MDACTPTQLHHVFMYAVVVTFACLALFVCVVAMWERWRLGSVLLAECCGDRAMAWAELRQIRKQNAADDRRMREAMAEAYGGRHPMASQPCGDGK
jgi:hypothetical protein